MGLFSKKIKVHPHLLKMCPWMSKEKCSKCRHRDPPQLERTGYVKKEKTWQEAFLDSQWHKEECCVSEDGKCSMELGE